MPSKGWRKTVLLTTVLGKDGVQLVGALQRHGQRQLQQRCAQAIVFNRQ
jgi:hypothetical protein